MSSSETAETALGVGQGQVLAGRYELLGLLGTGGMGSVYRARDRELDEVVALKMLRRDLVELPGMLDRFRREAKLARKVTHTNVARTFDIGEHEGAKFLTMEYVEGESLGRIVEREGRLPMGRVLDLVAPLCAGLSAAHAAGIVHRDLKPDNVLVGKDGRIVVTDFGIARAVAVDAQRTAGAPIGTPMYMAPEQVEAAQDIDARADIYALGAMLYELLTGAVPWEGDSAFAIASRRLLAPPPDPRKIVPTLPDTVASVVLRCMARRREDRFASAADVAAALASVTHPAGFSVAPAPPPRSTTTADEHHKSVAVLPFRNAGTADDDYLADGLTEDLIDTLSMNRLLRVRSRGAVIRWKGVDADPRTIGRELDVAVVADGSVRRIGDQLRVTVKLVSVEDGFQLWAKRFDRPAAEILAVGDEAARAIADALAVDWRAPKRAALTNPAALDLFLRGRHEFAKRLGESTLRALELYDQALVHAPNDSTILSHKAMALARAHAFGRGSAELNEARAAAENALAHDPQHGAPHLALATIELYTGDSVAAGRHARRAVSLSPMLAEAHELYGRILGEIGHTAPALEHLRSALRLDPRFEQVGIEMGRVLELAGDREGADEYLAHVPADELMEGQYWVTRARVLMWRRDTAGAAAALARIEGMSSPMRAQAEAALGIVATGVVSAAVAERLDKMRSEARTRRRTSFVAQLQTEVRAFERNVPAAIEALGRAVDADLVDLHWLDGCVLFEPLRTEPAFVALRDKVATRARVIAAAIAES
jgi:serine/threonine-protein kinase